MVMSLKLDPDQTAVGELRPGNRVQVLLTRISGKDNSTTSVVLPSVRVYAIEREQSLSQDFSTGGGASDDSQQGPITVLSLVVSPQQAVQLVNAEHNGDLDVALLPPGGR